MSTNYVQPGKYLSLTAPAAGVTSGVGVVIGAIFCVPTVTAAATVAFNGAVSGVWKLAKVSTEVWVEGDKIYFDNANSRCSNVPTAAFRLIGVAVAAAANPTTTGYVRLSGPQNALAGTDWTPAPASHSDAGAVTVTAAELLGGIIVADPSGAGRTYTLPTAALLVAAIPGVKVGDTVRCLIVNGADAAEAITIAAGSGGAFDANQTATSRVINQFFSKTIAVRITVTTLSSEAYVVYV